MQQKGQIGNFVTVAPSSDEVSVCLGAHGYIVIRQCCLADGIDTDILVHPLFAEALCGAIMGAAKAAGGK